MLDEDGRMVPIIAERGIASNTCRHREVRRLECHENAMGLLTLW